MAVGSASGSAYVIGRSPATAAGAGLSAGLAVVAPVAPALGQLLAEAVEITPAVHAELEIAE